MELKNDKKKEEIGPLKRRKGLKRELNNVIAYWRETPYGSGYIDETSIKRFLEIFTPTQIKGAMDKTTCKKKLSYSKYLYAVLHSWRRMILRGETPNYAKKNEWNW